MIFTFSQFAVDDDAKSVPESLEQIGSRLRALESNQTSVSGQLARISSSVTKIMVSQERMSDQLMQLLDATGRGERLSG